MSGSPAEADVVARSNATLSGISLVPQTVLLVILGLVLYTGALGRRGPLLRTYGQDAALAVAFLALTFIVNFSFMYVPWPVQAMA